MNQTFCRALVVVLIALAAPLASATWPPAPTLPHGWGVQLKNFNDSPETLDAVRDLGLKYVRRGFIWSEVEKQREVYNFARYDRLVADCKARGLSMVGVIALNNEPLYPHVRTEEGRAGYSKFAAALAYRYRDDPVIWEIWNEPNTMTFWGKHGKVGNSEQYAEEYLALLKATVVSMQAANPQVVVMGGSVSGLWSASYQWMGFAFQKGILQTGINAWSVHPYSTKMPEDYLEAYAKLRRMMTEAGAPADFPILNSERGFPLGKAEGAAGGDPAMRFEYQAWHLVRQYFIDALSGIQVTIWYEWSGKDGFALHEKGRELPVERACRILLRQVQGYTVEKRLDLPDPRDFALRLKGPDGAVQIVAWTAPPAEQSPDAAVPHLVRIPVESAGPWERVDLYGESAQLTGQSDGVELMLSGAPQYLILGRASSK